MRVLGAGRMSGQLVGVLWWEELGCGTMGSEEAVDQVTRAES